MCIRDRIEEVEVPEGEFTEVNLFDGSTLRLETLAADHDYTNAVSALSAIHESENAERHVTGLLYYNENVPTATDVLGLSETALVDLSEDLLRPDEDSLERVNATFRS